MDGGLPAAAEYHCTRPAAEGSGMQQAQRVVFEDFLPSMARKLGAEGLIEELCKGFQLLMDPEMGVITLESLKTNAGMLGLEGLQGDELLAMVQEGDLDGDGTMDQMEFCILMFRLSPELMESSHKFLEHALGIN